MHRLHMRAIQPHTQDFAINRTDGVRIHYEDFGGGERTILFLPAWSITHSRLWTMQVSYFAHYFRVVTFDGRGNGAEPFLSNPYTFPTRLANYGVEAAARVEFAHQLPSAWPNGLQALGCSPVYRSPPFPSRVPRLGEPSSSGTPVSAFRSRSRTTYDSHSLT